MTIAEKIARAKTDYDEVYEAGYAKGQAEGGDTTAAYDEGFEAGKKAEYDAFWDDFQNKGKETRYDYAFAGQRWTVETFRPKYDLIATNAQFMFAYGALTGVDLTQHLESLGVILDTSQSTSFKNMFYYGSPKRVPTLDTTSADSLTQLDSYASVETFDKIILRNDGSQLVTSMFQQASPLINLTLEGVIGQNGLNLQWSTNLTHDSLMSVINVLKDNSGTDTWNTITLGAENLAKLSAEEIALMESKQWNYS